MCHTQSNTGARAAWSGKITPLGQFLLEGQGCEVVMALVSLVSVSARNWCYLCERFERVEKGETVEIANVHAVFMQVAENMIGCSKRLGEYPTLSAMSSETQ